MEGRGLFAVTGDDRVRFVNAMVTGDVRRLSPGDGCYAFALDARGRIVADLWVFVLPDAILLDTERESKEKLHAHLERHLIGDDAEILPLHGRYQAVAIEGPHSPGKCQTCFGESIQRLSAVSALPHGWIVRASSTGLPGVRLWVLSSEAEKVKRLLTAQGIARATEDDLRVARIECGRPRFGEELSSRFLGPEANIPGAIAFGKGCYLGQEVVERIRSRKLLGRKIVTFSVKANTKGPCSPLPGTRLFSENRRVGEVLSAAYSFQSEVTVGLACIQLQFAVSGVVLRCNEAISAELIIGQGPSPVVTEVTESPCDAA